MYDISLSYMMYLPVSHSIPLTIILHSAFCKIPLPVATHPSSTLSVSEHLSKWFLKVFSDWPSKQKLNLRVTFLFFKAALPK